MVQKHFVYDTRIAGNSFTVYKSKNTSRALKFEGKHVLLCVFLKKRSVCDITCLYK